MAVSGTFQLALFNGALRICREAKLQSLSEGREAQYLLTDVWNDGNGAVQAMLEQGYWNFAQRTSKLTYDPGITPNFGLGYVFEKPSDWVRTMMVCQDDRFRVPLTEFRDEAGYLYADLQSIYFSYVSNGDDYGANTANWPQSFVLAFEGYLAERVIAKLSAGNAKEIDRVEKLAKRLLTDARSKAAMNESAQFLPAGSWVRARWGRYLGGDRGNTGSLYG